MTSWDEVYDGTPPWDIGRPQPAFVDLVGRGLLAHNPVLDVGCGTGENALYFSSRGFDVVGIDAAPRAIEKAKRKARDRGLTVAFLVHDALDLAGLGRQFAIVTDCGLFHTFDDEKRPRFVEQVWQALKPGGAYFMMCMSEKEPADWDGPRRVTRDEVRAAFARPKFLVRSIEEVRFETNMHEDGAYAYMCRIERP